MRNKATGHKKTLRAPDTGSVIAIPIVKVPKQNFMLPPAESKDTEYGQKRLGGGARRGKGAVHFLEKALVFCNYFTYFGRHI